MYWQKVKFYIRVFPVNKDCNRDMARFPSVFDTNPPATACLSVMQWFLLEILNMEMPERMSLSQGSQSD